MDGRSLLDEIAREGASIQNSRTLAEAEVDQAKLARSVLRVQKFTRLHADAIGRKTTVWPKV